ncbi:hypothetical protein CIG2463D_0563 [Campylobacter iguaniorum]|uniref:HPt domain-containing protein n=1 Tax=Campylobacter iguaniorum TaxID=1244531 RepID=A0A076F9R7_9BACT|nr:Hpt domain-containing protein [Campylobacter iguaniorum]AII14428.1 hypothetical protein CIG1485E_0563 [Campylobacter iguaniorum]ALV24162.1 hypothetical protein CIG2463D_0563 [Campylobacter iguaniorum]
MGLLEQLEIKYDLDIVGDFLTHFGIMVESLDPLIINLSRKDLFKNNIDELFRIFHNIKSASGFLQLDPIIKLSSLCEDILEEVRSKKNLYESASNELIDWLLLIADQMEIYRRDIENDEIYFHILNPKIIQIPRNLFS